MHTHQPRTEDCLMYQEAEEYVQMCDELDAVRVSLMRDRCRIEEQDAVIQALQSKIDSLQLALSVAVEENNTLHDALHGARRSSSLIDESDSVSVRVIAAACSPGVGVTEAWILPVAQKTPAHVLSYDFQTGRQKYVNAPVALRRLSVDAGVPCEATFAKMHVPHIPLAKGPQSGMLRSLKPLVPSDVPVIEELSDDQVLATIAPIDDSQVAAWTARAETSLRQKLSALGVEPEDVQVIPAVHKFSMLTALKYGARVNGVWKTARTRVALIAALTS